MEPVPEPPDAAAARLAYMAMTVAEARLYGMSVVLAYEDLYPPKDAP